MTYGELEVRSNHVANNLLQRWLNPEEPVAVMLPASCEYVVALLGILKAGGAYLPIDPQVPDQRLNFLLRASGCRFALTHAAGHQRMGDWTGTVLELAQIVNPPEPQVDGIINVSPEPDNLAYIIYTSGSTGQPKGVEIEHHSLTNLVSAYQTKFTLTARDRASLVAKVGFDASVAEVWPTLCAGGSLFIAPPEILRHPDSFIAWLVAEEITFTFVPTGMAEILFTRTWPATMALRYLITGGDRLCVHPPPGLPFTIVNAYGPTENTVISTMAVLEARNENAGLPAIGQPLTNLYAYVLDENRQPVADGVAGELYLGGEQVARGYLGQPALTAENFVTDPFISKAGSRMYRTGDWVRRLPAGELDFIGRLDNQVQLRGTRIELGEIEAALLTHPIVRQACCLPQLDNGLAIGISAHIAPLTHGVNNSEVLCSHLRARLPANMVPSQFVFHEHFPLTPHGKVDRQALANLPARILESAPADMGGGLEIALSRLWHSLLPAAAGSAKEATFASLGGDSLLLVKLMLGVEEIISQRMESSSFLVEPTFPGLCRAVKARMSRIEFQPVLALRKHGTRPPLFCLYNYNGDITEYFGLAEAVGDDQPVYGIRSPALENLDRLPVSIEAAAAEVVGIIRTIQPHGAPSLVGYSWAGWLVYEVARQLQQREGIHCFTALIGTEAPMRPTNLKFRLAHFVKNLPHWFTSFVLDQKRWRKIFRWRELARWTKEGLLEARLHVPDLDPSPLAQHQIALIEKYQPLPKSDLTVDLFRERDSYQSRPHPKYPWQTSYLPDAGWNSWLHKPIRVHWVAGEHMTIYKPPAVSGLARAVRQAMEQHGSS